MEIAWTKPSVATDDKDKILLKTVAEVVAAVVIPAARVLGRLVWVAAETEVPIREVDRVNPKGASSDQRESGVEEVPLPAGPARVSLPTEEIPVEATDADRAVQVPAVPDPVAVVSVAQRRRRVM